MCCNQASYQEGTHPKTRDWTTSTLLQAKKIYGFEIWGGRSSCARSHSWFSNRGICPCCRHCHPWLPGPREGMSICSVHGKHSHTLASDLCADRLTISLYTPVKACCCLNALYFWPADFQLSTIVPGMWSAPGTPALPSPPVTARSEDHPPLFKGLPGSNSMRCPTLSRIKIYF